MKNLTFLSEIFQIQTIDGGPEPTRPELLKIGPTWPKNFDLDTSLVSNKKV